MQFYTQAGLEMNIEGFPDWKSAHTALSRPELKHFYAGHTMTFGWSDGWYCDDCDEVPR